MALTRAILAERRLRQIERARREIIPYAELLHEDPRDPDDAAKSLYTAQGHHHLLARKLQACAKGHLRRLIVCMPPRHGKTELSVNTFVPWFMGQHPELSAIVATYSDTYANDLGRAIRKSIDHPASRQTFPALALDNRARSVSAMKTTQGGAVAVVGRGSAITGRGGDILVLDDPLKDRREADSPTIRDSLWSWFNQVFLTRLMTDQGAVILIMTRWHEDDPVGRLTDPNNDHYSAAEARRWELLNLPALSLGVNTDDAQGGLRDPLDRPAGEALWPARFSARYLRQIQEKDPRGFSALYQGAPAPAEGAFFNEDWIHTYGPRDLPHVDDLNFYVAADFAVSTRQEADKTCLLLAGVDNAQNIYVHPQLTWQRMSADMAVEALLWLFKRYKPAMWFGERGQLSHALLPFLRKRMAEEMCFCALREFSTHGDKQSRAASIAGRMSTGMVKFPAFADWWRRASHEVLTFPQSAHDDFVDALGLLGRGLESLHGRGGQPTAPKGPETGTLAWVKYDAARSARNSQRPRAQGW